MDICQLKILAIKLMLIVLGVFLSSSSNVGIIDSTSKDENYFLGIVFESNYKGKHFLINDFKGRYEILPGKIRLGDKVFTVKNASILLFKVTKYCSYNKDKSNEDLDLMNMFLIKDIFYLDKIKSSFKPKVRFYKEYCSLSYYEQAACFRYSNNDSIIIGSTSVSDVVKKYEKSNNYKFTSQLRINSRTYYQFNIIPYPVDCITIHENGKILKSGKYIYP